jgi:anti-anti-sigma factor
VDDSNGADGSVQVDYDETTSVLTVSGELDGPAMDGVAQSASEHLQAGDLALDLSGVTFLPSSAISALVGVRRHAKECGHVLRVSADDGTIAARILYLSAFPKD